MAAHKALTRAALATAALVAAGSVSAQTYSGGTTASQLAQKYTTPQAGYPQPHAPALYPYLSPGQAAGLPVGQPVPTGTLTQYSGVYVDPNDPRTDTVSYSPYIGRQHGNIYYTAPINRQLVDDRPYIVSTSAAFQAQYANRRAGMRQLDAQNRRSGYRMVNGTPGVVYQPQPKPVQVQQVQYTVQQPQVQYASVQLPPAPAPRPAAPNPNLFFAQAGQTIYLDRIFFDHDQDVVTAYSQTILLQLREFLLLNPESWVVLEGHADQSGDAAYNIGLSNRRSQNSRAQLIALGVPANRIRIAGFGEARPDKPAVTADGRRLDNRRVVFRVVAAKSGQFRRPQVVRSR